VRYVRRRLITAALLLSAVQPAAAFAQADVADALRHRIELARTTGVLRVDGATIDGHELITTVYEQRQYAPLWLDPRRRDRLLHAILALYGDGLDPQDYHAATLTRLQNDSQATPERNAEADLVRTSALLRAAHDLRFGRIDAATLERRADFQRPLHGSDAVAAARALLEQDPVDALHTVRPRHFTYTGLVAALAALRDTQRRGGWSTVPHATLALDSTGFAVPALRRRLHEEGDLPAGADTTLLGFDVVLQQAVRSFQHRHGLNPDGVVGPATLRQLQLPLAGRIDQVRVNLERARWVVHDLGDTFVAVNIAGALVYFVRDGTVLMETRAIVGRTATRTPTFTATMRHVELNPTWTVPPGIVGEVLAEVRRRPGWLAAQGMRVLDHAGRSVNPSNVDFARYSARTFPYVFRQDPGPLNPLGTIKFVFPNSHNVYLHDTPARQLFDQEVRMFSHGCIRIQNPVRLAALVLDDPASTEDALQHAIGSGRTRVIPLKQTIPVLVLYWTAAADLHGALHFHDDVYSRDAALLRALDRR
jgi:L,D-transpeptidase YcbB